MGERFSYDRIASKSFDLLKRIAPHLVSFVLATALERPVSRDREGFQRKALVLLLSLLLGEADGLGDCLIAELKSPADFRGGHS